MGDFTRGPQNNLSCVVHALRSMIHLQLGDLASALPVAKDLLATHGVPTQGPMGGEIKNAMAQLGIGFDDITTRGDLIAVIELAAEKERK